METIIKSTPGLLKINIQELWNYRELFYIFVWRDIKVRYKQTIFGLGWAIFQPLVTMIIFSFFFGKLAGIPSGNLPYPVFVYTGLVFWTFFSSALTLSSNSLIEHNQLLQKVFFPRLIVPLAAIITCMVDFVITLLLAVVLIFIYHLHPHPLLVLIFPLQLLILFLTISGLGLFLSAFNVKYRDVRYILPFFIQILMFLTPVIYSLTIIAPRHKWLLLANPLTGIIESARVLISGSVLLNWQSMFISLLVSVAIFIFGLYYFRLTEKFLADVA